MTPTSMSPGEQVSALADGQLQGAELERALAGWESDGQMLARWRDYHVIGDVLRGAAPLASADEAAFLARLRPALQAASPAPQAVPFARTPGKAANQPWFAWRRVAAVAASLALVAGVSWSLLGLPDEDEDLALGETAVLAASQQGVIVRDAALEELMEAHRQQAGALVLPMPSGFLRNATFEAEPAAVLRSGRGR